MKDLDWLAINVPEWDAENKGRTTRSENEIISKIAIANVELAVLKSKLGPASIAMASGLLLQYAARVNLMRQNGATFTDILTMLMEQEK